MAAVLNTSRSSELSRNGAVEETPMTVSPNGADSSTAVRNPAAPVVRMRSQPMSRSSKENPRRRGSGSSP